MSLDTILPNLPNVAGNPPALHGTKINKTLAKYFTFPKLDHTVKVLLLMLHIILLMDSQVLEVILQLTAKIFATSAIKVQAFVDNR